MDCGFNVRKNCVLLVIDPVYELYDVNLSTYQAYNLSELISSLEGCLKVEYQPSSLESILYSKWRREKTRHTASHVISKTIVNSQSEISTLLNKLKSPIFLKTRDLLWARVFFSSPFRIKRRP